MCKKTWVLCKYKDKLGVSINTQFACYQCVKWPLSILISPTDMASRHTPTPITTLSRQLSSDAMSDKQNLIMEETTGDQVYKITMW